MKKFHFLLLSILVLSILAFFSGIRHSAATQEGFATQEEYVPNEVLVKFNKDVPRTIVKQDIEYVQGRIVTYLGREITTLEWDPKISTLRSFLADPNLFQIRVPDYIGTERAIILLSRSPNVEYAEKNFIGHADQVFPNDEHFSKLWGLHNTGQTGGTADADIDAPEAWDIFTDSSNTVVAVIDSGINYNHEDLQANIWTNPGETGGGKETDGIDNDGNGYIDDWRGWNFTSSPGNNNPMDDYYPIYHGTHVAGTIGAVGNNNNGVVGVCWRVKLMALKWLNSGGSGTTANVIRAIDYSTYNGSHLSNNSWHVPDSGSLLAAIGRAQTNGKIFIAAAGNDNINTDTTYPYNYPSCYDLDNIISVAATDHNDNKSPFSNYGPYSVDLGGPGGTDGTQNSYNIYSTKDGNYYQYLAGTSMAAPHVAGEAALTWGHRPGLNWWQVRTIIMKSVNPLGSLYGKVASNGRQNAYNALTTATPNLPAAPSDLEAIAYGYDVELTWEDNSNNEDGFFIYRKTGNIFVQIDYTGANVTTYWDYELLPGYYTYYVRAYNQDGNSQRTLYATVKIIW